MELKQYVRLLWRWSWLIGVITTLAGLTAYVASNQMVPIYEASTTLLVNQAPADGVTLDLNALRTSEVLARTYIGLLGRRPVLEAVIANLKLDMSTNHLEEKVRVADVRATHLILLTVEDPDPQRAADIANEMVRVFIQQNQEVQTRHFMASKQSLEQELANIQADINLARAKLQLLKDPRTPDEVAEQNQTQILLAQYSSSYATLLKSYAEVRMAEAQTMYNLSVFEPAVAEERPIRPKTSMYVFLAAVVGAVLAIGMVFLVGYLDNTVKSSEEVEELIGFSTLATISRIAGTGLPDKLVTALAPYSPITEAYRLLRINIEFSAVDSPIRTIVVTSGNPGEGKSLTAANLAIIIAQSGKRVILVDTDLRRPALHRIFEQSNLRGVTTALLQRGEDIAGGQATVDRSYRGSRASARQKEGMASRHLVPTGIDNLRLLLSGPLPPNPAELLGSQRMIELIAELKTQADVVLFDSPPLLAAVDAAVLAGSCDAALLVVRAASTRTDALQRARDQLWQSGTRLLGVALNGVSSSYGSYVYSYYHIEKRSHVRRFLRWPGLRLPFFRSRNGSRLGSSAAVEAPDSIEPPSGQTLYRNGNGNHADPVEALAEPEPAKAPNDRHSRNGNRGDPSVTGRSVKTRAVSELNQTTADQPQSDSTS